MDKSLVLTFVVNEKCRLRAIFWWLQAVSINVCEPCETICFWLSRSDWDKGLITYKWSEIWRFTRRSRTFDTICIMEIDLKLEHCSSESFLWTGITLFTLCCIVKIHSFAFVWTDFNWHIHYCPLILLSNSMSFKPK